MELLRMRARRACAGGLLAAHVRTLVVCGGHHSRVVAWERCRSRSRHISADYYPRHSSMAALLLERGALSSQRNDAGRSPFDMICEGGERHLEMPTLSKMLCAPKPAP